MEINSNLHITGWLPPSHQAIHAERPPETLSRQGERAMDRAGRQSVQERDSPTQSYDYAEEMLQ